MKLRLRGKRALVTWSTAGIGFAMARAFGRRSWRVSRKRENEIYQTRPGRARKKIDASVMQTTSTHLRQAYGGQASVRTYAELQEQLHRDLLAQNPGWIEANGDCPKCDDYDRRFAELISFFRTGDLNSFQHAA